MVFQIRIGKVNLNCQAHLPTPVSASPFQQHRHHHRMQRLFVRLVHPGGPVGLRSTR